MDAPHNPAAQLEQSVHELVHQMASDGLLDAAQFAELLQLQDESNPSFVTEVVLLYFQDSGGKIERMGALLTASPPCYHEVDQLVHQFKGSSASLGAALIAQLCTQLREHCQRRDGDACVRTHRLIAQAWVDLRARLAQFVALEAQRRQLAMAAAAAPADAGEQGVPS